MTTILCRVIIKDVSGSRNSWSCFCSLVWVTVRFGFKVINPILFGSSIMFWNFQSNEPEPNQSSEEVDDLSDSYSHGFSRSASASTSLHHIGVMSIVCWIFGLGGWRLHLSLLFDGSGAKRRFQQMRSESLNHLGSQVMVSATPVYNAGLYVSFGGRRTRVLWFHKSLDWWIPEKNKICESFHSAFSVFWFLFFFLQIFIILV